MKFIEKYSIKIILFVVLIVSIIYSLIDDCFLMISFPYLIFQGLIIAFALLYRKKEKNNDNKFKFLNIYKISVIVILE